MWLFWLILIIIIFIIVLGIVFKILKLVLKVLSIFFLIIVVVSGILGFFVYDDVMDLKQGLSEQDNLLILQKDNQIFTGIKANFGQLSEQQQESFQPLTNDQVIEYGGYYNNQQYELIKQDNYKVFFIDYTVFQDIEHVEIEDEEFSNEFILTLLESNDPDNVFKTELKNKGYHDAEISRITLDNPKSHFFVMLFNEKIQKDKFFLVKELKNKNIIVYPETITFKVINYLSVDFVIDKLSGLVDDTSDKVQEE